MATRVAMPTPRPAGGTYIALPAGAFANHVISWPDGAVGQPDPFAIGVASDLRKFVRWNCHEPVQGSYVWAGNMYDGAHNYYANADSAVTVWHAAGKKVLLCLSADSRPAWCDLNNDAAWSAWVSAAVTRWQPEAVEFINEPSGGVDITWLVRMYSLGKAAAKAAKPDIIIVGPSCESISNPGNGVEYTASFLNAGGAAHIDALGVHLYPHGLPNHEPASIVDQMAWLHSQIDSIWSGPIWNTEAGCAPEIFYTQPRETQLRWFWQTNMLPTLLGCAKSFWYAFGEDNYGPYNSPYLADIRALWQTIVSFHGTVARWKMLPDGRLRVIRDDGAEFAY